ncbi:MAG: oligosaccharyl transferase, archaeosortase A system-associated [Natrialbaceae archaeon]
MSNWRDQLEEESETKAAVAWLSEYYHYPVLLVLIGFAFWNRIRNWSNFVVDGDVYFTGNDPWYHYRSTRYASENFLATMPFDPWTNFPFGASPGQYGTLFDQIVALVALIVGLGSPSESLVRYVALFTPPFVALAICLPAYFIGRRLGGRFGGIVTVGFVALAPDRLLQMTIAGNFDHHSAEVLFMMLAVLAVMVALTVAEREKPVYELLVAGDVDALRGTIGWSLLAGVAIGLYLWVWPPGVLLYGIMGVFFVFHLSWEYVRRRSPEHAAFVGAISLTTAGTLQLATIQTLELSATSASLLQPGLAFAVAGGVVFMAWLSREVEVRDFSRYAYPGIVAGLIAATTVLVAVLLPDLFDFFYNEVDRVLGFITSPGTAAGTIGEAQPPSDRADYLYTRYGLGAVTAVIGALVVFGRQIISDEPRGEQLFVVFVAAFVTAATFTQVRFGYYLTVPIGALNAVLAGFLIRTMGTPSDQDFTIETYQVLTIALVVLVMFVPLLGLAPGGVSMGVENDAGDRADALSQPGDVLGWEESLAFLEEDTPVPGQYGDPGGDPMEFRGTYERTDDYEYPEDAYGVLSWWDYGHWITTEGERIANANPFQQNARGAADFLLAQDEEEAQQVLDNQFEDSSGAQTKYVMVDWMMAETESQLGGKYFAPIQFHDEYEQGDFYERIVNPEAQITSQSELVRQTQTIAHSQRYYDSMLARLYHYHGSAKEPEPIGLDRNPQEGPPVQGFDSVEAAEEWASEFDSRQVGGVGVNPEERVEALEHFRLVHTSNMSAIPNEEDAELAQRGVNFNRQSVVQRDVLNSGIADAYAENDTDEPGQEALLRAQQAVTGTNPAWTKTFERVEGATIEGQGPAEQEIRITVEIEPENGTPFAYEQYVETDDTGAFNATVPYSTTGYDELGVEEGYTEPTTRANSSYSVQAVGDTGIPGVVQEDGEFVQYSETVDVTESQVVGEDDSPVEVELEGESALEQGEGNETDGTDGTDGSTDGTDGTDDSTDSTDNETSAIRTVARDT